MAPDAPDVPGDAAAAPRTLVVMRHAKAENGSGYGDIARSLTRRGRDDAAAAGRFLAALGAVPDHALVSSATRTQETWQEVRDAAGADAVEDVTRELYGTGAEAILARVQQVDPDARVVAVVGHNPDVESLAFRLSDGEGDNDVELALRAGFPTSTLAVYAVTAPWSEVTTGSLRVQRVHVARAD